jgi:CheY-like chemotaxis protein
MKSTETLMRQLDDQALTYDERVHLRCQIAEGLEHRGQYEAARDTLAELWQGIGQRPKLEGLTALTAAELLLRTGSLSGFLGSAQKIEGAQEAAKNLISESINSFQSLGDPVRTAAAQSELGCCYWREGAYDSARIMYDEALKKLSDNDDPELRAILLRRYAVTEACSGRHNDALRRLIDATPLFKASTNHALKGKFHLALGGVLMNLGKSEHRLDYTDRAIIEYTAAAFHLEQAGHTRYCARTANNLGVLFYNIGRYADAHEQLNHARRLFLDLKDTGIVAQVDETIARVLLAEGKVHVAARVINGAVQTLLKGDEQGALAEALTTQGRILARLADPVASQKKFRQAADLAEQAGAVEDAGRALLALVEEHGDWLTEAELLEAYERADSLLKATQDAETVGRLRACARRILTARRAALPTVPKRSRADFWANFSLAKRVRAYEARYIRRALIEAGGSISRAARLLGIKHHASLAALLRGRHKSLTHLRTPAGKRRRSIVRLHGPRNMARVEARGPRAVRILYIEDNDLVAGAVRESLGLEGWHVEIARERMAALKQLNGSAAYDLLLFDNELPGISGVELVRTARQLDHRRRTPIIMFSASDVKLEAELAGVDAFLYKPEDLATLVEAIERTLAAYELKRQP